MSYRMFYNLCITIECSCADPVECRFVVSIGGGRKPVGGSCRVSDRHQVAGHHSFQVSHHRQLLCSRISSWARAPNYHPSCERLQKEEMEQLEEEGNPTKDWVEDSDYESQPVVDEAFFTKGRDLQSTAVNHKYTEKEREVLGSYDSMDYLPPHSQVGNNGYSK